jgi:hypothetical protein
MLVNCNPFVLCEQQPVIYFEPHSCQTVTEEDAWVRISIIDAFFWLLTFSVDTD